MSTAIKRKTVVALIFAVIMIIIIAVVIVSILVPVLIIFSPKQQTLATKKLVHPQKNNAKNNARKNIDQTVIPAQNEKSQCKMIVVDSSAAENKVIIPLPKGKKLLYYFDSKVEDLDKIASNFPNLVLTFIPYEKNKRKNKMMIVDQILFINLKRRPDRYLSFVQNCPWKLQSNSAFEAIDGKLLKHANDDPLIKNFISPKNSFRSAKPVIGCILSHLNCFNRIVDSQKITAIFEDDALFYDNATETWENAFPYLPKDFDVVFLGNGRENPNEELKYDEKIPTLQKEQTNPHFWNLKGVKHGVDFTTVAILYSPKGAQKLLDLIRQYKIARPMDWIIFQHADKLDVYAIKNWMCYANICMDSDIHNIMDSLPF